MTRNTCVSAFICGSHICMLVPSELESIRVGPLWRPSTETLMRQPSASIIGICSVLVPSSCAGKSAKRVFTQIHPRIHQTKELSLPMDCRVKPGNDNGVSVVQRREQTINHLLRDALVGRRLEQRGDLLCIEMRGHFRIAC